MQTYSTTVRSKGLCQQAVCSSSATANHRSRQSSVRVCCSIRARWCIDVRYGSKLEATGLLQEWVKDVGSQAGLSASNTRLCSGSIGVPESRLEMEVEFGSTAEWEQFLARIPFKDHKAWSQRAQGLIIDGSPKWEVFRTVPVDADQVPATAGAAVASSSSGSSSAPYGVAAPPQQPQLLLPGVRGAAGAKPEPKLSAFDIVPLPVPRRGVFDPDILAASISAGKAGASPPAALPAPPKEHQGLIIIDDDASAEVVLDWKGEPMKLNPKDKLPFKFL